MFSKEYQIMRIEGRINLLSQRDPSMNKNLINALNRELRALKQKV